MKLTSLKKTLLASLALLTLNGCLPVEDISPAWNQAGFADPQLNGLWMKQKSTAIKKAQFVQFTKDKAGYYIAQEIDERGQPVEGAAHNYYVKTMQVGVNRYMLITDLSKDEDKSGIIVPYKITENSKLEVFAMKPCDTSRCTNDLSQMADALTRPARDIMLGFDASGVSRLTANDVTDFDTIYINYPRWTSLATYQKYYEP